MSRDLPFGKSESAKASAVQQPGGDGYYVFWETWYAYGSRGNGLTHEAAEALAQRIREGGPNAP